MQIILIHPRKAGAVHLSRRQFAVAMGAALLAVAALSGGATWLAVKRGLVPGATAPPAPRPTSALPAKTST